MQQYDIMLKFTVFAIVTAALIIQSWKSLRKLQSHGFFRFFAFELILVLILLNVDYWFHKPFSALQIISWLLLLSSLFMAVQGFYLLHEVGKPKHGIEDTTILVSRGIYKYIRHPLYSSLLLLIWGIFLKNPSIVPSLLAIVACIFLAMMAKIEEKENLQRFGQDYLDYMKTTKMFIPFLI